MRLPLFIGVIALTWNNCLGQEPGADILDSSTHTAVMFYACKLTPPEEKSPVSIKFVTTWSPKNKQGDVFCFKQNKKSNQWIFMGDLKSYLGGLLPKKTKQELNLEYDDGLLDAASYRTRLKFLAPPKDEETNDQLVEMLSYLARLVPKNEEDHTTYIERLSFRSQAVKQPPVPEPAPPTFRVHKIEALGLLDRQGLSNFATAKPLAPLKPRHPLYLFFYAPKTAGYDYTKDDIVEADAWIACYCAANNNTIGSSTGQDVFGVASVFRSVTADNGNSYSLVYYTDYFCLDKSAGDVSKIRYGIAPELDLGLSHLNPWEDESKPNLPYSWVTPTLPALSYDKTTGLEQSLSLTLHPPDQDSVATGQTSPETIPTPADKKSKGPAFSFNIGGMNSFEHGYYKATAGPKWAWTGGETLGATFDRSVGPKGSVVQTITDGKLASGTSVKSQDSLFNFNATVAGSAISTPTTPASSPKKAGAAPSATENTDEYSGTFFFQNVFYLSDGLGPLVKLPPDNRAPDIGINGEVDLNAWFKPTESTQNPNFYSDILSRVHLGLDVPTPPWFPGPIEFLRFDASITGGGIIGTSPSYDRFNAGSNVGEGVATADIPDQPMIRSLGVNSASVYSVSAKTSGAVSYANANVTVAIPVPYLSVPVFKKPLWTTLADDSTLPPSPPPRVVDQNNLDYAAFYEDILSFKPLFAGDAVYMGAPMGFQDRSIASVGVGGEVSLGALNLDVLYAKSFFDTSTQTKSANLIFQATYDIHF